MKRLLICVLTLLFWPLLATADERVVSEAHGVPTFMRGELGSLGPIPTVADPQGDESFQRSAQRFLEQMALADFGATGDEALEVTRVATDDLGKVHVRFDQFLNGLRVVGAEMVVHAEAATGDVYAVNGDFAPAADVAPPSAAPATLDALDPNLADAGLGGDQVGEPEKLYFYDAETGVTHLTWKVRVRGTEDERGFFDHDVYLDAASYEVVAVDAHLKTAKSRNTHDATGSVVTGTGITGLPGTLVCNESTTSCGDDSAQRAHDGAGEVYDYYQTRFSRDSLNDSGMTLVSSVHVGSNWPNAAWYSNQMVYGDGDGTNLDDLTKSFDVIAHELGHGVTDFESDLIYQKEPGALNEAWSDIFGVSADSFRRGGVIDASTWLLGEEVFTPGTPGDALRYMNDPDTDGYSKGYYPERLFSGFCIPSGSNDYCGVHGNSGIANLAYYLLVEGGTHPRGKTSVVVPAIGMADAEQIFYRAQTTYLVSSSNFEAARNATAQAAADLYTQTEVDAVHAAWCAVGVPGCPPSGSGISFSPADVDIKKGRTQQLTATVLASGAPLPGISVTFSSEDPAVATIQPSTAITNAQGKATATVEGVSRGRTGVTAQAGSETARAPVKVPVLSPLGMMILALLALFMWRRTRA